MLLEAKGHSWCQEPNQFVRCTNFKLGLDAQDGSILISLLVNPFQKMALHMSLPTTRIHLQPNDQLRRQTSKEGLRYTATIMFCFMLAFNISN